MTPEDRAAARLEAEQAVEEDEGIFLVTLGPDAVGSRRHAQLPDALPPARVQ